jgi:hypothetical protein
MSFMKRIIIYTILIIGSATTSLRAQDNIARTPEEQRELFNYCDKPDLIKQAKISNADADKIGDLYLWATKEELSIQANTNERFATIGEMEQELAKKYKAIGLGADQVKIAIDLRKERRSSAAACPVIMVKANPIFDTIPLPRAVQLYKTPYRKMLLDKLAGVNGRQVDMLFETEVWKQKESWTISAIPVADFNRVRRTVSMYKEREHRYKAIGLSDDQILIAIQFFDEHQIGQK